jgi:hypothetical protein
MDVHLRLSKAHEVDSVNGIKQDFIVKQKKAERNPNKIMWKPTKWILVCCRRIPSVSRVDDARSCAMALMLEGKKS